MAEPARSVGGDASWLPDFCSLPVFGSIMLVAELVVLVVVLAPDGTGEPIGQRLVVASVFGEWLALCMLLCLCRLRPWLAAQPHLRGVALAYACVLAIAALGSIVVYWLDHALSLRLTIEPGRALHFMVGITLLTALVAAAALRYFYVRAQWQHEVRAQAKAQVAALQARIRPHFLFNSMNTIASLIRSRPAEAERAVEDLCELFRAALSAGEELRTLGDELELIERYLAIEQLRLGARLSVRTEMDELPRDLPIPALLLQPLVENAVLHGIQPLAEGGTVTLRGRIEPTSVRIDIHNPRPLHPPAHGRGNRTALDNVRQRLRYQFGERAKLEVEEGAGYYAVSVYIPRS